MTILRDPTFRPRTVAEWDEYVSERAAIGEYERGMSRAEAEEAARIMAGPRPDERGQAMSGRDDEPVDHVLAVTRQLLAVTWFSGPVADRERRKPNVKSILELVEEAVADEGERDDRWPR